MRLPEPGPGASCPCVMELHRRPGRENNNAHPAAGRRSATLAHGTRNAQKYANGIGRRRDAPARERDSVKLLDRVLNPREIRRRLGLNQEQFWTQIGVTQSGGSRYESGREMPKPVRELLRLVHVEQIDLTQVKRVDFEIISYLKESHPDLYRNLRRAVRSRHRSPDAPAGELPPDVIEDELDQELAPVNGERR
jgi:DNA-binding transcriptional regulator YiaG